MENHKKITLTLLAVTIALFLFAVAMTLPLGRKPDAPEPNVRNRVPTMPQSIADAQKAAAEAQAAATAAQAALRDMQAAKALPIPPPKPPESKVVYTADGTPQESTGVGRVSDVTELWEQEPSQGNYGEAYMAFTFVEDGGFQKHFYPVCSDQVIQTGKASVLYHWATAKNNYKHNEKGCFKIDGYIYQKTQ